MDRLKMFLGLLICGVLAFGASRSFASVEEMQILVNTLVEKGQLTADEGKEVMKAVEKVSKQKEEKQKAEASKNTVKTLAADNLTLGGYVQGVYNQYGSNKTAANTFSIQRAVINLRGSVVDNVLYKIEADVSRGYDSKNNVNNLINEAWVKFAYLPQANLSVGQYFAPFSEEFNTSSADIDTILRSMVVTDLATQYERGLLVDGNLWSNRLYYGVAFSNGAFTNGSGGTGADVADNNNSKDVAGRVILTPFATDKDSPLSGLKIGASYQTGKETFPVAFATSGTVSGNMSRWGALLKYQWNNLKLQGEYINSKGPGLVNSSSSYDPGVSRNGWYALAAYTFRFITI